MDFLGLATFRTISTALDFVRENRDIDLEPAGIPFDDAKTFELLSTGGRSDCSNWKAAA